MQLRTFGLGLLFSLTLPAVAVAQPADRSVERTTAMAESIDVGGDYRHKANDWMISPRGTTTVSGSLRFITADAFGGDSELKFTDVVLTSVAASRVLTRRLQVNASASFLPKQPSFTDELVWQSASAGARLGFGSRYALYASGSSGTMLGDNGMWSAASLGVQGRKSLHETTVLEGGVGGGYTGLFVDGVDRPSWVTEAIVRGELIFRVPNGMWAGWLGSEFRFPMVRNTASMGGVNGMDYDPQTRVNVELGTVVSHIDDWDIFAKVVIVDRGDAVDPTTTLPILEGGFDQTHVIVGLTRRFKAPRDSSQDAYRAR